MQHGISVDITNDPECISDKSVNFEAELSFFAGQSVYWYKRIKKLYLNIMLKKGFMTLCFDLGSTCIFVTFKIQFHLYFISIIRIFKINMKKVKICSINLIN